MPRVPLLQTKQQLAWKSRWGGSECCRQTVVLFIHMAFLHLSNKDFELLNALNMKRGCHSWREETNGLGI